MCIFHKWGKWEQYEFARDERHLTSRWSLGACIETRQRKKCERCGKVKDEYLSIRPK